MENQSFLGLNLVYSFELNEIPQPHLADCVRANWFSAFSEQNETNFRGLVILHKIKPEKVILLKELTNTKERANMTCKKNFNKIEKYLICYDSIQRTIATKGN